VELRIWHSVCARFVKWTVATPVAGDSPGFDKLFAFPFKTKTAARVRVRPYFCYAALRLRLAVRLEP